jgi:hypothetical protein
MGNLNPNIIRAVSKLGSAPDRYFNIDGLSGESYNVFVAELEAQYYVVVAPPIIEDPFTIILSAELRERSYNKGNNA